jgi:hypothetical protein
MIEGKIDFAFEGSLAVVIDANLVTFAGRHSFKVSCIDPKAKATLKAKRYQQKAA